MQEVPLKPAELALEQSGLEFLRNGKFRKARDAFKSLSKSQPSHALPLLIEANLGLAREMMSKGLVSEANQVLAYLKTIAPASLDLDFKASEKKSSGDAWSAMVPLAARRLATSTDLKEQIRAADEIILGADSPDHTDHPEAKAILRALELGYSTSVTDQTTPLLRTIPRSSPFSHWVIFFKGMTALESGDHSRAADCFRRVPENSMLQASLAALLTLCGKVPHPKPTPRTIHALCAWAGHPALAEPLMQAEPLWRKQERTKAFTVLTNQIPGLLCWGASSFKAELSRFLATEFIRYGIGDLSPYKEKVIVYTSIKSRFVSRAVVDQAFFAVDLAEFSSCSHSHFQTALVNLDNICRATPISPAMQSRIFTRLGENYIAAVKQDPEDLCSPPTAKKALEMAINRDPGHLHAWLTQCDLLAMGKDRSSYHRFVDDLAKRFPKEKEALIRNGDCCVGRGSYTKALRNFEDAAKLDSVDPRIACGILRARLGMAEESYKKRQPSKVNWALIESLAYTNQSLSEFTLWRLRVRQIILEARYGDESKLFALAAETLPLSPNPFLLETACRIGIAKYKLKFMDGILEKMFPSRPTPQSLADFLAIIDEVETTEEGDPYEFANNIGRQLFTWHQSLLLEFVVDRKDLNTLLIKILSSRLPDLGLASSVLKKWFASHPTDPVLLYICGSYGFPWFSHPAQYDQNEIAIELRESRNPDDQRLFMLIERDKQRASYARFGRDRRQSYKLDLDYNPHPDDEYGGDDEDFTTPLAPPGNRSGKSKSTSNLLAAIAKILGENGPGGSYLDLPSPMQPPLDPPGKRIR